MMTSCQPEVKEQLKRSGRDGLGEKREEAVRMLSRSLYHVFNLKDTPGILILVKMAEVS